MKSLISHSLKQEVTGRKKICSTRTGCGKLKKISSFYRKGLKSDGRARYESVCKMCKKKKERNKYKSKRQSQQYFNEFSLEVVPRVKLDNYQREKTRKVLRDLVLEALRK